MKSRSDILSTYGMDEFAFVVCGDTHVGGYAERAGHPQPTEIRRTQEWLADDLRAVSTRMPRSEFCIVLGDLTENGSSEELTAYRDVVADSPIEIFSIFGGHDGKNLLREGRPDPTQYYRRHVGPLWYSFERHRIRFIARVSEVRVLTPRQIDEQNAWLVKELSSLDCGMSAVLLQHTPPTRDDRRLFDRYPLAAVLYGHQHCVKIYRDKGVLVAGAQAPNTAGFNGDPRSFLQVRMVGDAVSCDVLHLPWTDHERTADIPNTSRPVGSQDSKTKPATKSEAADDDANWSDFYGGTYRRLDMSVSGTMEEVWRAELSGTVMVGSPVVAGGKVYLSTQTPKRGGSQLHCLDATSGARVWQRELDFPSYHTPVVLDSTIAVSTSDGSLHARNAETGALKWSFDEESGPDRWAFHGPGAYDGKIVYRFACEAPVTTGVHEDVPIAVFDPESGAVLWRTSFRHTDWMSPSGLPLAAGGRILVPAVLGDGVSCFNGIDGSLIWNTAGLGALVRTAGSLGYSPEHSVILASGYWKHPVPLDKPRTGSLCAFDLETGRLVWEQPTGQRQNTTPVAAGDRVLVGEASTGMLRCYDIRDGHELWSMQTGKSQICTAPGQRDGPSITSTPVVAGRTAFVGAGDGFLYSVDIETGKPIHVLRLQTTVASSPAVHAGRIYVADYNGTLYCIRI